MQRLHNFMAVDPGVNTGWAYWWGNTIIPRNTGVFRAPSPKNGLENRLRFMFNKYTNLMTIYRPAFVVIEGTEDWGSAKSRVSSLSGALQLLSWLVGGYAALSPAFIIKMPREWKGGLNDRALELRIARALGQTPGVYREHEQEAVGLGLSQLGVL